MTNHQSTDQILLSIRLGWLSVEAFGRLRRWARSGRKPSPMIGKAAQRFNFSDRDLSLHDQLICTLKQLKSTATQLVPDLPSFFPDDPVKLLDWSKQDVQSLWNEFENWSREVWIYLQIRDPLAGQAFTYGGGLADTYWHADGVGGNQLQDLLRSQRLEAITVRFDSIAEYLPDCAAEVIHKNLYRWRIAGRLKDLDEQMKKRLLTRLEAQAKVWYDLLFGLQQAQDYLRREDRSWVAWGAFGATALLMILMGLATWLAVLLLSWAGQALLASASSAPEELAKAGSELAGKLLDWQNWSALLATLSSVVVVLTSFITRFSGWMISFHQLVYDRLMLQHIFRRSYRGWEK